MSAPLHAPVPLRRPAAPDLNFWPTRLFLVIGLFPLGMLFQFWFRSGTGLNPVLVGFLFCAVASFALAVNYYLFYQQNRPRSALVPPAFWKVGLVAALLIPAGAYNMLATSSGLGLTLSPGPRVEAGEWPSVVAKVIGTALTPGAMKPLRLEPRKRLAVDGPRWFKRPPYMNGALWGALGYAIPFALLGLLLGLMRREVLDPRDEHLGATFGAAFVRAAVGMYYGMAIGFLLGVILIFVLRGLFPVPSRLTPETVRHFLFALGASTHPNVAFSYAFSAGSLLAGAFALISRNADITAPLSDPKAPELTRPVEVLIPEVPEVPTSSFDMARVRGESQTILKNFRSEVQRLLEGPEWQYERYPLAPLGGAGQRPEPEATQVISARLPADEDDAPTVLGSLSHVYVPIVAELGKLEIPAADWLGMAEGVILALPKSADGSITVTISGKPAARAKPLTVNGYKAVKLLRLQAPIERLVQNQ
ncbi:MAG: FliM/FliN family flagellar motor C-terminal domain-containing protein [Candidatus Sericytochromatia bacterium]|nr:FliM/FliN family flagellar motor C-terminal domain-containing protein [Candidatus Sericytochromatia bacterium]